ncbi:helix-turn-helix domain-containing protein [Actinomadura sp. 7K507]|uniref:helix-turn-helix domain-containing protein n=1 Tax=Actinomadura sp. 7K507 TaxID=2530365 RepID=UPI00104752DF|nr:helix-turn-helix domain-containing protein [Actinomadura sp. 7K507]TDC73207.1 AraC family transcriptional regulator [Actinomadura sp. 7K507]
MDWLLEHYGDASIGVASMAAAAQVSVRQLQALCHTHLDTTPGQLIREVRLHQARRALLAAHPVRDAVRETIRDIAAGVGYLSPSNFGAQYSAYYSEAPSTTLRRAQHSTPPDPPADPPPDPA